MQRASLFLKSLHSFCHEQSISGLEIAIISEKKTLALGKAFGEADEILRVNTSPELMSIQEEDTFGFQYWLNENKIKDKYPARKLFSIYLQENFKLLKNDRIFNISIVEDEAVDIEDMKKGKLLITTKNGQKIESNKIILSLGYLSSTFYNDLKDRLILPSDINSLNKDDIKEISVAGTGLTSIDCIRHLKKIGAEKIYIFSRNNQLPTPITKLNKYTPKYFLWSKIKSEPVKK